MAEQKNSGNEKNSTKEKRRFLHESHFLNWFDEDFPSFTTQEGLQALEERADEIIAEINNYFHPDYMKISENARYLKPWLDDIKTAYNKRDYEIMGIQLERFKLAIEWM